MTLNPFSKKSIERTLQAYANDLPSRKFLDRRLTLKDGKGKDKEKESSRKSRRSSNADRMESVTLVRASKQEKEKMKHVRDYSFAETSQGRLKYASLTKDKAGSVLDRYRRSSLSSPYKDEMEEKRRAISRTHDTVSLKQPINISPNLIEIGKRLFKENKFD